MSGSLKAVPPPGPNTDVVETIEELLADARAGKIRSFAFAASKTEGLTCSGVCFDNWIVGVLGELEIVKGRILDHLREINGRL